MRAGSCPFGDLSRTSTTDVVGALFTTNSARPIASGSFTPGERTTTSAQSRPDRIDSSTEVTDGIQPMSSGSRSSVRATCCRKVCGAPTERMRGSVT